MAHVVAVHTVNTNAESPAPAHNPFKVDPSDLLVCSACCCAISSLYTKWPNCCGCYVLSDYCCVSQEGVCCKPVAAEPGDCCMCQQVTCKIIWPKTCCEGVQQTFCLDSRCAFPCNKDVPCLLNVCFLTCCYNWACMCKCCAKVKDFSPPGVVYADAKP